VQSSLRARRGKGDSHARKNHQTPLCVGTLANPFTATIMIGFIAGAGIILREGMPLALAVEETGVVRFRPMLLTAAAVLVGSAVMLADPIFQGLAIALIAGQVAATLLSLLAVPLLYYWLARHGRAAEPQREGARSSPAELATIIPLSRTGTTPWPRIGSAPSHMDVRARLLHARAKSGRDTRDKERTACHVRKKLCLHKTD
jgi:hypothetical protein